MRHIQAACLAVMVLVLISAGGCGQVPVYSEGADFSSFTSDFEGATVASAGWNAVDAARADSITIVSSPSPVHAGTRALRMSIAPGDKPTGAGNRVELGLTALYPWRSEVFVSWRVYFPSSAYTPTTKWQVCGQFHDAPDPLRNESWAGYVPVSPPVNISIRGTKLQVTLRSTDLWGPGQVIGEQEFNFDAWNEVVMHIRWSTESDGFVWCRINGTPVTGSAATQYRHYGRNMRNKAGNFFRLGLYRDETITTTDVVYFDSVKIGKSLAEVQ